MKRIENRRIYGKSRMFFMDFLWKPMNLNVEWIYGLAWIWLLIWNLTFFLGWNKSTKNITFLGNVISIDNIIIWNVVHLNYFFLESVTCTDIVLNWFVVLKVWDFRDFDVSINISHLLEDPRIVEVQLDIFKNITFEVF